MSDIKYKKEDLQRAIDTISECIEKLVVLADFKEADLLSQESKEIFNSIEVNKTFKTLDEHRSDIKESDLSYDDLLDYAAMLSASNEVLEFHNEVSDKQFDAIEKSVYSLISANSTLQIMHESSDVISENKNIITSACVFFDGKIEGGNAQKINQAKKGAKAKLAKDPRQAAKSFVLECWNKWQKNPDNYKSKAAFARDMLTKQDHLKSQKKIEDWCREWEKQNGTLPAE